MRKIKSDVSNQKMSEVLDLASFQSALTKEFKPRNEISRAAVESSVRLLAQQALSNQPLIQQDAVKTIQSIIFQIDNKLTEQLNEIIHHPDFQALEGTWRGIHYLVSNSESSSELKIRVMDISKQDLSETLRNYRGMTWDQSPIFKRIYEEEFGQLGGEPFGCIVGDYQFDHSMSDVELLTGMSRIAASSHCPFIAAASPNLLQMDSWSELGGRLIWQKFSLRPNILLGTRFASLRTQDI